MPRVSPSITAALAVLAGAEEPAASPLRATTRRRLAAILDAAREDILASVAEHGVTATAEALGVSRSTLAAWRAAGGWLAQGAP